MKRLAMSLPSWDAAAGGRAALPRVARVVETVVVTFATPIVGWFVDRSDPFLLEARFPWLFFTPLLVALRHGFTLGFGSAVLLDVALVVAWRTHAVGVMAFPGATLVGLAALAMIVGQFSDVWARRVAALRSELTSLRRRAEELSRSRFLLELSHDRLDEQVERATSSLRDALAAVRALSESQEKEPITARAGAMMEVFAGYCGLEVGELFAVASGALGERWAVLGRPAPPDPEDPLLRHALESKQLTYVPIATLPERDHEGARKTRLLAAIPFVDEGGVVRAILAVHAMPFVWFDRRNVRAMATLAAEFAALLDDARRTRPPRSSRESDMGDLFDADLRRALRDVVARREPSAVACVLIRRSGAANEIVDTLLGGAVPELDAAHATRDASGNALFHALLPRADDDGARALESRIASVVDQKVGLSLARAGVRFVHHVLGPNDTAEHVLSLLERKVQHDEVLESAGSS